MSGGVRFADTEQSVRRVGNRLIAAIVIMALLTCVLLARLSYLQIVRGEHYTTLSQKNRIKIQPLPPPRGLIYSRDGELLAENRPSFVLAVDTANVEDLDTVVARLKSLLHLADEDVAAFFREVTARGRVEEIPLSTDLTEAQVAKFEVRNHEFPGVRIDSRLTRYYPNGRLWAHAVGYVGRINEQERAGIDRNVYLGTDYIGKTGVEKTYEALLHGTPGYQQVEINAQGRILRVLERTLPVPGYDVYLNIDASLQRLADAALAGKRGAIVAIDPQTGDVLALVSAPSFDPNPFVSGFSHRAYDALRNSPDKPLFNRALLGEFPPGSTVKPFFALAALESGVRVATDTTWCPGYYRLQNVSRPFRDWREEGHGHVDMVRAIAESCDVYFYDLAHDLGIEPLAGLAEEFGFGKPTGIDLPGEAAGRLPTPEWKQRAFNEGWYPGDNLNTGIGQGYSLVTPVQLAFATAVLSRRGVGLTPSIVGQIEDPVRHEGTEPQIPEREIVVLKNADHWHVAIHGMEEVVHGARGTARQWSAGAPYRYAGKTGTAQVVSLPEDDTVEAEELDERLRDHAWFIAFAPIEHPEIAVAILVENGASGNTAAAPIARAMFDRYLLGASDAAAVRTE